MPSTASSLLAIGVFVTASAASANTIVPAPLENQARPSSPQPDVTPPAPPSAMPPAVGAQSAGTAAPPALAGAKLVPLPSGQWVFTQEYGWLWMPYDRMYAQVVENPARRFGYSAVAYEYAYYPAFGWRWVVAPWILRIGAVPYCGALGPERFAWYAHPWFRIASLEGSKHDEPASRSRTQEP